MLADVDDTAKAILTLSIMGRNMNPEKMIAEFDTGVHFRTYRGERNPSFSANCNVLHALLHTEDLERYQSQILRAAEYVCEAWCAGNLKDKWVWIQAPPKEDYAYFYLQNTSINYSMMLCSQTLARFLEQWAESALPTIPEEIICERIASVLTQIFLRTAQAQEPDGSWGEGSCEVTAYAVLTLISVAKLPWILDLMGSRTLAAIDQGKEYLRANHHRWDELSYIWIEKVTYASPILSQAYCLAAMKASPSPHPWTKMTVQLPTESIARLTRFFKHLPLFSHAPDRDLVVTASLAESYILLPRLRRAIPDIFPRNDEAETKYMEYIPFTWIGCNNLGTYASSNILMDMMIISVLNFQVDQYMEAIVIKDAGHDFPALRKLITKLCQTEEVGHANGNNNVNKINNQTNSTTNGVHEPHPDALEAIEQVLSRFIDYILAHPATTRQTRLSLRNTLSAFLHAHLTQLEDNAHFITHKTPPSTPYYDWVHTTSAAHTSCPYSFLFFCCLLRNECFTDVRQRYLAQDLCAHLAIMCRMYNDAGSVKRDLEEGNVNSVDFDEFDRGNAMGEEERREEKKADLLCLAEYERECLDRAFTRLEESGVQKRVVEMIRLFSRVTDLYGQIYVARDLNR